MTDKLQKLKKDAQAELGIAKTIEDLDAFVVKYFGRQNGLLTQILKTLPNLDEKKRREIGAFANDVKVDIWKQLDAKRVQLRSADQQEFIDLAASTKKFELGHLHPLTLVRREMETIFENMGFAVKEGPDIETDYYNFEALNMPPHHPARDMWDTFYIKEEANSKGEKLLLRTHISPMQARIMKHFEPPLAVVSSGRVFRHEATDARHEHTFDYMEGFVVGENITVANLKHVLQKLFSELFGEDVETKLRPSYFPFTEPSFELIMGCIFCNKKGCSVCHTGWLEMLGAGMIHPKVFEHAGYPKGKYSGYAFGIGISRVAMLKYDISDIRMLYQNDQRLLNQF